MKELKAARAISESSTTSDNTSDFIDIVKRYDVVYNNHNPDYKNVEVKMKVWTQIADEIGLSVEASKRKWKNLRDSYTKYLRSFRVGTKTSKKYQYWAHADHMEFLKPYQGPGRNSVNGNGKSNDEDETECDFGYQMLAKTASNGGDEDLKITTATTATGGLVAVTSALNTNTVNTYTTAMTSTGISNLLAASSTATSATGTPPNLISPSGGGAASSCVAIAPLNALTSPPPIGSNNNNNNNNNNNSAIVMPLPPVPPVSLANSLTNAVGKANAAALASLANLPMGPFGLPGMAGTNAVAAAAAAAAAQQMFPLATLKAAAAAAGLSLPPTSGSSSSSTGSNVGCVIIEPHMFAAADNFKKELNAVAAATATTPLSLFQNLTNQAHGSIAGNAFNNVLGNGVNRLHNLNGNGNSANNNNNNNNNNNSSSSNHNPTPPLPSSKVRRVPPSQQTGPINLSCSAAANTASASASGAAATQQPPAKTRKISDPRFPNDWDVTAVLQANRDLDANTLFFLSLARQVRAMPMKFQSLAKMRCMRIVSDIELELENFDCNGVPPPEDNNSKFCGIDTPPPPPQLPDGSLMLPGLPVSMAPDGSTEHFVYVMSPSRVESMIDISSDEETNIHAGGMATGAPAAVH